MDEHAVGGRLRQAARERPRGERREPLGGRLAAPDRQLQHPERRLLPGGGADPVGRAGERERLVGGGAGARLAAGVGVDLRSRRQREQPPGVAVEQRHPPLALGDHPLGDGEPAAPALQPRLPRQQPGEVVLLAPLAQLARELAVEQGGLVEPAAVDEREGDRQRRAVDQRRAAGRVVERERPLQRSFVDPAPEREADQRLRPERLREQVVVVAALGERDRGVGGGAGGGPLVALVLDPAALDRDDDLLRRVGRGGGAGRVEQRERLLEAVVA